MTDVIFPGEGGRLAPSNCNPQLFAMNTSIPLSLLAMILSGLQADAQCRRFSKQRVLGALEADMVLDRIIAGAIGRGETATLMPIHDSDINCSSAPTLIWGGHLPHP